MDNIKIIKKIGEGAFAECFLCRDYRSKLIAIKRSINEKKYEGIKHSELREIYCLVKLRSHPNIIPLYEISINNNNEYIFIMKYVKYTLDKFVEIYPMKDKYILSFIRQMLSVLYYLEKNEIIHTDIKCNNILISYNNELDDIHIYLIDFGSANIENLTERYTVATTYTTRAPEVYNYDGNYNSKIDIWSFGMMVYYMIFKKNYVDHNYFHNKTDVEKLKYIYQIDTNLNNSDMNIKFKYFLLNVLIVDPIKRPDAKKLIMIFKELYNTDIVIFDEEINKFNESNSSILLKIEKLNKYITSRLNYINLIKLDVSCSIYNKVSNKLRKSISEIELIFISWFINYQFTHSNVDYDLIDFIPVINSFSGKNYSARYFCELTYDILSDINFSLI